MSKKIEGVALYSKTPYAYGVLEDSRTQFKYQTLMQDYQDLQREAFVTKSKLDASKQRKQTLVAEVRFLRRRYKLLVKMKTTNSSLEQKLVQPPNSLGRTKIMREHNFSRKEATLGRLLPIPELKPKKKRNIKNLVLHSPSTVNDRHHGQTLPVGKEATRPNLIPLFDMNWNESANIRKETLVQKSTSILDLNMKGSIYGANDAALMKSMMAFDLNQVSASRYGKEGSSLPSRGLIFDLNEISTGDEEIQNNCEAMKLEEAKKSLLLGNTELHNDLKRSVCRSSGETLSHAGKRKISWKDPVALRA